MSELQLETCFDAAWRPEFIATLVFLRRHDEVLLIHKKTGHGAGKINAPGGKLDPGEGVLGCAVREVVEEVGMTVQTPVVGVEMRFVERNGPQWLGFALLAEQFSGTPRATREADPFWCGIDQIPYSRMWPDDAVWLPRLLERGSDDSVLVWDFLFEDGRLLEYAVASAPSIWEHVRG